MFFEEILGLEDFKFGAFPDLVGLRILSLESVYFETSEHFSGHEKKEES